jgi:uncharacterized protein YndB with AHSA1/START domain
MTDAAFPESESETEVDAESGSETEVDAESEAIVREVWIAATPEDVFPYFTDADKLRTWKAAWVESDGRSGGGFRADITGRGDIAYGTYLEIEPPRRVVFTWEWDNKDLADAYRDSVVEVTLAAESGGTLLRLVHRGVPRDYRGGSGQGWTHYLSRLVVAAAGRDPGPDAWATAPASERINS